MNAKFGMVLLCVLLLSCGKNDPLAGSAVEQPVDEAPVAEAAEPEAQTEAVIPIGLVSSSPDVPTTSEVPLPSPSDEEIATTADRTITALFADGGMTKVEVVQKLPDGGELKQSFVYATTNKERIAGRLAAKLGISVTVADIIWNGNAPESHSTY